MHAWTKGVGLEEYKETVDEWAQRLVNDSRWNSAVAKDDTDDMMKQLTEGIKGAAGSHFPKVSAEGKYKRSEKTETLYEEKQQLRDEARRLKMQPFSVSVVLRGWQCMARLQRKDKELGKSRRADRRARTAGWAAEMHPARWRGDWCEIWRLARSIAGTGLGPKRRTYGDVAPMQATAAEMARYLEQEGPAGGCRLQVVMEAERADEIEDPVAKAFEHKKNDKDDLERETGSEQEDVELVRMAKEDLEGICQALRQGKSRRAVPVWSARRELWLMALCEARHLRRSGRCQHLVKAVQQLLLGIRRRVGPPAAWNTSQAVLLDKKNGKRGPAAKRIINLLDPLGKGYYKQIWRRAPPRTWHFATGFTQGRRREQGILQARVVQHRLKQKGKGYISSSYDVSNAFPSMAHSVLDGVIDYKFADDKKNADILKTRYREAYMYVQTETGGAVLGKMRAGGMQGDSIMPEQFGEGYNEGVEVWAEQTRGEGEKSLIAKEPTTGDSFDTSISVYADDLWRTGIVKTMDEAQAQVEEWDESIDTQLHLRDMGQNRGKKEHMVKFIGKGAAKEMQRAYMEEVGVEGTMRQTVRYLGAWLNVDGKNGMEVRKRKEAAHAGWMAMGGLWSNNQIERSIKIVVFRSLVKSSLLSGQEAVCLLKGELETMEKTQNWYLCRLMRRGTWNMEEERWTSKSMAEVRRELGVATIASEMRSRRIKWLQQIGQHPERNMNMLAALTGSYEWDMIPQLTNEGWATEETNPWLAQFLKDLDYVCQDSEQVAQEMIPAGWYGIFCSKAFWKYDTRRLWRYGDEEETIQRQDERLEPGVEEVQGEYLCECGKMFAKPSALVMHKYRAHGQSSITKDMMVNNQCPWCKRAFTIMDNRASQRQHMRTRLQTGQCAQRIGPGGAGLTRATEPATMKCPRCDEDMHDTDQLLDHISRHLDQEQTDRTRNLLQNGVPVDEWEADEPSDETGSGIVQDRGGTASRGNGEDDDQPGRAYESTGRSNTQNVSSSQGTQSGTSGSGSWSKILRSGTSSGKESYARHAASVDIRSYFSSRRGLHDAKPREGEDTNADPGTRGRPANVQGQSTVVHLQGAVQERRVQDTDYSYAERRGVHGDDHEMYSRDGRRREAGTSSEGPGGETSGQIAEGDGSVGRTSMSFMSGAGLAGATDGIGP